MPLKLVRRPKSPNWVIRGTVRRIRVEESTQVSDRKADEEIRAKRESEILEQSIYGRRATATFAQAALSYLENDGAKRFLKPVIKHFGTTPLARIDQDAIDRGARRLYPNASAATRNRQFYTPVSAVMTHAARRGLCAPLLLERPAISLKPVRWLKPNEAKRLVEACGPHLRPLVIFMLGTGCRIGEALWLDWRQVELARAHVTFPKTKNGEPRGVPLHSGVIAALANLKHRDGCVFRRPNGLPYERLADSDDDTSAGRRIATAFRAACKRAGVEGFTPHGCRHTWATLHYALNHDLGALMRLGGWKSERMVLRYAHVNVDELRHTIEALPGGIFGEGPAVETKKIANTGG
jgi:integrase